MVSLESFDDTEYNTAITPWGQAEAFEVIDGPLIILLIIALPLGIFSFARSFGVLYVIYISLIVPGLRYIQLKNFNGVPVFSGHQLNPWSSLLYLVHVRNKRCPSVKNPQEMTIVLINTPTANI